MDDRFKEQLKEIAADQATALNAAANKRAVGTEAEDQGFTKKLEELYPKTRGVGNTKEADELD